MSSPLPLCVRAPRRFVSWASLLLNCTRCLPHVQLFWFLFSFRIWSLHSTIHPFRMYVWLLKQNRMAIKITPHTQPAHSVFNTFNHFANNLFFFFFVLFFCVLRLSQQSVIDTGNSGYSAARTHLCCDQMISIFIAFRIIIYASIALVRRSMKRRAIGHPHLTNDDD